MCESKGRVTDGRSTPGSVESLPNPEHDWAPHERIRSFDPVDVERRIGTTNELLEVLRGGLANLNIRIGKRVLRIYERDKNSLEKEALLLVRPWQSFRVPALLGRGKGVLLLEYVSHGPLIGTAGHGATVGRALAEIHATAFPTSGFFGSDLSIGEPLRSWTTAVETEVASDFSSTRSDLANLRESVLGYYDWHRAEMEHLSVVAVLQHGDFKPSNLHWTTDDSLLVLDWKFAFAGPPLMDVGQLSRWSLPHPFIEAFDLVNLVELLGRATPGSRQARDLRART